DGQWKVTDYVLNGRPRTASIGIDPSGMQEADGLRLRVRVGDLRSDGTGLYLALENDRDDEVRWAWAALGVPRGPSWRYEDLGLFPEGLSPRSRRIVFGWARPVPLDTSDLRLILVEKGRKATFDLVVHLAASQHDVPSVQPAPDAVPLRLRLSRSPLGLLPALALGAIVVLLGGCGALGYTFAGLSLILAATASWNRSRGRPVPLVRALAVAAALFAGGLALLLAT
ncbi:MAG TPA: hypothetical protein VFL41_03035, partial [Gaiellaceae bacterium]|nr:hypothetical protein [Gaiellaceae bacterium]